MLIYVFGFRDQEEQAAGAALLLVGVDERRAAGDRVSDVNRLQVFEGVATVEPALAILQRLWQGRRLGAERDHERGGRFFAPARVVVADRLAEAANVACLYGRDAFCTGPSDLGLQTVADCRAVNGAAHLPRGRPSTRSAMMLRWISDEPA